MISITEQEELEKFNQNPKDWWDPTGPFKTLHEINPIRLQFMATHAELENAKIVDLGCGGGILSEALAKKQAMVTGVDLGEVAIAAARDHAATEQLPIQYVHRDIPSFAASHQGQFDVVTCMELLEHVDDPESIIQAAANCVKPAGKVFFSTINRTPTAYLKAIVCAEYLLKLLPIKTHDYSKCIKPAELDRMARRHDLQLIAINGMHYNPFTKSAALTQDVSVNYLICYQKMD